MTNFSWYGYEARVDLETTQDCYEKAGDWDCPCGHCRNFVALARERKLPEELLAILDSLSIPPEKATYVCELYYDKDWREKGPALPARVADRGQGGQKAGEQGERGHRMGSAGETARVLSDAGT